MAEGEINQIRSIYKLNLGQAPIQIDPDACINYKLMTLQGQQVPLFEESDSNEGQKHVLWLPSDILAAEFAPDKQATDKSGESLSARSKESPSCFKTTAQESSSPTLPATRSIKVWTRPQPLDKHASSLMSRLSPVKKTDAKKACDPNGEDITETGIKKNHHSLAFISLRVKQIVLEHGALSYRQISNLVLKSLGDHFSHKESSNIRRRVNDALNVLISVRILRKENKNVYLTEYTGASGRRLSRQWGQVSKQQDYLSKLRMSFLVRKQVSQSLRERFERLKKLRERNMMLLDNSSAQARITFPFMLFGTTSNSEQCEIEFAQTSKEQAVTIKGTALQVISDFDSLTYLGSVQH